MNYNEKSYGKWILSGEHAVLRGGTAIVYPLKSRFVEWSYTSQIQTQDLMFQFKGIHGAELEILILGLLEKAFEKLKISKKEILGKVQIFSSLPLGAGLGASAALCVSVAKWFHHLGLLPIEQLFTFSKEL
ncbi:MAG TPA: hypothetical protein PLJ21_07505, partial [Pseudobdellovibrionaceae bacterium]|nr:hypothetical protein [Pseudobdellovibrionaceae bacterium]